MNLKYDFCILPFYKRSIRADQFICDEAGILTRNQLKQRIDTLKINGRTAKLSRKISPGDHITVEITPPPRIYLEPEEIQLDILYEDSSIIVVNKPQGMVVHPAPGNYSGTLVHGLLFYQDKEAEEGDYRPGIVHRLDKDTSGVLVTAKDDTAHNFLAEQFKQKRVKKIYYAICRGQIDKDYGRIENMLGRSDRNRQRFTVVEERGKLAVTEYRVVRRWKNATLVKLTLETGRTHQLRVHMRHIGHPILGDPLYGDGQRDGCSLMLHAFQLTITLPKTGNEETFCAALPKRFATLFRQLNRAERSR